GESIPPNSELLFEIKLVDLVKKGEENYADMKVLRPGSGPKPEKGQFVTVKYAVKDLKGNVIDDNQGKPLRFEIGKEKFIGAVDQALQSMQVGEKINLRLAPNVASHAGSIGAEDMEYIELELLSLG